MPEPFQSPLMGLQWSSHVDFVFFAEAREEIARGPDVVGSLGGAFGEDLELPLALGDFGVDALRG